MMTRYDKTDFKPSDISIDNFESPAEPHEFSTAYQARKAALLSEYSAQCMKEDHRGAAAFAQAPHVHTNAHLKPKRSLRWKVAVVAAAAALVVIPAGAFAVANNADFFSNAFGDGARESVIAHDENIIQGDEAHAFVYPSREYVDVDPEEAEYLLGDYLMTTPIEVMVGDHKITVLSVVRDNNLAVIHYTIAREGGVTLLGWSDLTNQEKGAYIPNDAPYYWRFVSPDHLNQFNGFPNAFGGTILVNKERTTSDIIDCYEYAISFSPLENDDVITLQVESREGEYNVANYDLPAMTALPSVNFTSAEGDSVSVSAISLQVGGAIGRNSGDYPNNNRIEVAFVDGTSYTVLDRTANLDNTSYVLDRFDLESGDLVVGFNRLVNPESIASITVYGVEFTR